MTTNAGETHRWLSAKQAAAILGVNRATVINWARQGKLAGVQYGEGAIYRFQESEVQDFIERSRLPSPVAKDAKQRDER